MSHGPTRAIGYTRVSTDDQAREGVSLEVQEARIRAFCEAKGWELVQVVADPGKSAKDLRRPGLQTILAELPRRQRPWDALVVVKLDRLTRSVKDLATLTEAFKRARVGFTSIQESVDTASASGELFFNLVAAVSQWERRAIGERTRAAMAHLRAQRRRVGEIPYGYRLDPGQVRRMRPTGKREPARLVPDPAEQRVLGLIARLRAQGLSLRAISAALARRGVLARNGRPFAPQTLARLVTRGALSDGQAAGL